MANNEVDAVLELLRNSSISNYAVAKATNISEATIGNYKRGKTRPTPANARILLQYFDNLNRESASVPPSDARIREVSDFIFVPMVPIRAKAGYLIGYGDTEYIEKLPTIPVMTDKTFHGKYRCFEVEGDSMDDGTRDALCDKDIVLAREVRKDLWQYKLHYKDWNFVIVHREGILIKRIVHHDVENHTITCRSTNPLFDGEFIIELARVVELYNVIKIVDRSVKI